MADTRSHMAIPMGSERGFAQVIAAVLMLFGVWPLLNDQSPRLLLLGAGVVFLVLGYLAPKALAPLNRLWFRLGLALGAVIAPIVMALLFYTTVTPIGLVMRAFGHDALRRRCPVQTKSYWIERDEPVGSMKNQF